MKFTVFVSAIASLVGTASARTVHIDLYTKPSNEVFQQLLAMTPIASTMSAARTTLGPLSGLHHTGGPYGSRGGMFVDSDDDNLASEYCQYPIMEQLHNTEIPISPWFH